VPGKPPPVRPGRPAYKLSSNENPFPPSPEILAAVADAAASMNRYPDLGCSALYARLSETLGVEVDQLAAGTGSVALIYHLIQAYCEPGDEVVYAWRSFEAYPIAVAVAGAVEVPVPLAPGGRHDLDAMLAAITPRTKVVVVCTPNNPTGAAVSHAELAAFLARVPTGVLVAIDAAYYEFDRSPDPVDSLVLVAKHPNVVAMRTFAKAYGLAGLRVGYLVGHRQIAAAVRACSLPFGVSSIAQAAAIACLDHADALLGRVEELIAERSRVTRALAGQGWELPETQANFVWFGIGDRTPRFVELAEEAGIVVRPFAGDGVRVTVAEPAANDLLIEVARRYRSG
jgi:histidinol-phosphate aminotransferase